MRKKIEMGILYRIKKRMENERKNKNRKKNNLNDEGEKWKRRLEERIIIEDEDIKERVVRKRMKIKRRNENVRKYEKKNWMKFKNWREKDKLKKIFNKE